MLASACRASPSGGRPGFGKMHAVELPWKHASHEILSWSPMDGGSDENTDTLADTGAATFIETDVDTSILSPSSKSEASQSNSERLVAY